MPRKQGKIVRVSVLLALAAFLPLSVQAGLLEFPNPVKGSEKDIGLLGTDDDGNGVRDDLDKYIASLEQDAQKRTALTSYAREDTKMLLLADTAGVTREAAKQQMVRLSKTLSCLRHLYGTKESSTVRKKVTYALLNNEARLRADNAADALLSGSILPVFFGKCDPDITGVTQ